MLPDALAKTYNRLLLFVHASSPTTGASPDWNKLFEIASAKAGYVTNRQAAFTMGEIRSLSARRPHY